MLAKKAGLVLATGLVFVLLFAVRQLHGHFSTQHHDSTISSLPTPPQEGKDEIEEVSAKHHVLYSVSTPDRAYFHIGFGDRKAINPSIIPHPDNDTLWIITAQLHNPPSAGKTSIWFAELVCNAAFSTDSAGRQTLSCVDSPLILPIAATKGDASKCEGEQAYFALNIGPHDARVFYGPEGVPYTIYGSNSDFTCFGQWLLDFRLLVNWGLTALDHGSSSFSSRQPTELQRPSPYHAIEKNWFLFWDAEGKPYVHHEIAPDRVFARFDDPRSASTSASTDVTDLAPLASPNDTPCLQRLLPSFHDASVESIHQATNSLSVTLCSRTDPACRPDDTNTFILTIIQHKSFYNFRSMYEPYALLFRRTEPFEVYAVSSRPLWIFGRELQLQRRHGSQSSEAESESEGESKEMLYVTSISWKTHGQTYHGFSDDVLMLAFGIEDSDTAGMDIRAGDLLDGMGFCGYD